jgi:hypothetical protein
MNDEKILNRTALSATLHCLIGCGIGEVSGLIIGTAIGFDPIGTIALAVVLAFIVGFGLSTIPLIKAGLTLRAALPVVFAADTLSITIMEIVDNTVMAVVPGAMDSGLAHPLFWATMTVSLIAAFCAAYPVNKYLLKRNRGHALVMPYHDHHDTHHH